MERSKYPDEVRERCLALIASGLSPTEVSRQMGLPKSTVHNWYNIARESSEDYAAMRQEKMRGIIRKTWRIVDRGVKAVDKRMGAALRESKDLAAGLQVLQKAANDGVIGLTDDDLDKLREVVKTSTGISMRELSQTVATISDQMDKFEGKLRGQDVDSGALQVVFDDEGLMD